MRSFLYLSILFFLVPPTSSGQAVVSYFCSFCNKGPYKTYEAARAHTCAVHNYLCAPAVPVYTGPSPEELRKKREQKDLREASDDEVDKGVDCYKRGDWKCAINHFREALEYDPGNEDAIYNLDQAIAKAKKEEDELIKKAILEKTETVPPPLSSIEQKYQKYMKEADNIEVPPPSWESMISLEAEELRIGHKKENTLLVGANTFVTALDLVSSSPTTTTGKVLSTAFKMLIIGAKATIAAQQEAEIVVFTRNASYERMLMILKDAKQGPQMVQIIKLLNEGKQLPATTNPELVRLAKACRQPLQGSSSVHLAMNAMLSKEAKGAFLQTAGMEAMDMVSGWMRGKIGTAVQNRFKSLREVNDKINEGEKMLKQETDPLGKSIIQAQLDKLTKKMEPFSELPEHIFNTVSQFGDIKKEIKE